MDVRNINVLVLAYLGDTIYEDYIRRYLIRSGIANVNDLQTESIKDVSAKSQSMFLTKYIAEYQNKDLSGVDYSPLVEKVYLYNKSI